MPTIVYQGLQSCFESQLIETTTLKLKVAAPKATEITRNINMAYNQGVNKTPSNLDFGGWNFIQSLSNNSSTPKKEENEKQKIPYVHPLTKTSPKLSQKSLELCTENLGSETGSDTMDISILSFKSSVPVEKQKLPRQIESRSKVSSRDFPPPLTTIRSSNPIQVKPHREDGRLIIKAVETTSKNTYFHAERSNGRLKLSFSNDDCVSNLDYNSEITNEENEDDIIDHYESDQANEEYDYDQECEEENDLDDEVEIGMEKFQRLRRCNESGNGDKGLCNWKPLWVATS